MDFFARLFNSSKKSASSKVLESQEPVEVRPKAESSAVEKYLESGIFCRESRVDQIESVVAVPPNKEDHSNECFPVSSAVITRTLDRWNPETCVRLLRMPSVQNYSGLRKLISESDKNWMIEFLDMGGLEVLFESVDRLSKKGSNAPKMERTLLLLQCISCLKAVTNSHIALEHIIQQRTYAKRIAEVLCSQNALVKKQLFEFMSTLCVFSEDGHYLTLDVFESHRVLLKLRYRFAVLIIEIKQAEVIPHIGAVLGLINCIILGACGFRFRTRLRNEFLTLGLQDLLESLKTIPEEEVHLQCSVFCKSQLADEEYARSMGIRSSFSHFALFQALLDKIEDTPLSASFLVLLQNLNQLDPTDTKTDYVWNILEEITERALSGAGSILRNWMLSEGRRCSLRSTATQTLFLPVHALSIEEPISSQKISVSDEDFEKDSVKSFSSRDSGVPVSRNQSFASSAPRSPQNTLLTHCSLESKFAEAAEENFEVEFRDPLKDTTDPELRRLPALESSEKQQKIKDKSRSSGSFFKTVGLSFAFINSANNKQQESSPKQKLQQTRSENTPLSLRSESPIPQNDVVLEESAKTKRTFSFSFFNRSKKYSLPKCPPELTINPPSPDLRRNSKASLSPASSRNGMTSMDVKRSRKQLSRNFLRDNDTISSHSSETTSTFEFCENYPETPRSPISRSFSTSEHCQLLIDSKQQLGHLSKSASDLNQSIAPPPPPPPPPPGSGLSLRNKSQCTLGLPLSKNMRSSWAGNSTLKEFEESGKRLYNTLPRPKSKMKTLNWAKIPSAHVSVHSIWSEIDRETKDMELNFEEMEKLFCQKEPTARELQPSQKQRATTEIMLLDSKRSLTIGVFLKQFKGSFEEVTDHVKQCKHKEIGAERLRTLLNLLPDSNEIKLLNSFNGDVKCLGTAEKFILRISAIDHLNCRVEGMLLLEEFPTTIQVLHDSVQSLHDACQELLTNKGLKNFLKIVLVSGNFMNSGSYAGNAVGFRLSTLPKLMDTRANCPRITLLHYLVEEIQRKDSNALKFTNDLQEKLKRCSRLTLESLCAEITQLHKTMNSLKCQIEAENGQLKKRFSEFIENGLKHLSVLQKKLDDIKVISVQLANRFCEDEKKFQLEECLNILNVFCAKIKIADSENKARKVSEEKKKSKLMTDSKHGNSKTLTL